MSTEAHDRMIRAFQEYFKWQTRFEYRKSKEAGIKARYWLSQIRNEASTRRVEIQEKQKEREKARNGKKGRPTNVSKGI